jgi:hypothetical protein
MGDLCRHPPQVYFLSYILQYSCTGKPKVSYWGSCPWQIIGLQEDVKCSPDNGSFLLLLHIAIPRRRWASSSGSQTTTTPEEPFFPRLFILHQPEAKDSKSPKACHHCNPKRFFGLMMRFGGPPFRDLRGTRFRRHTFRKGCPCEVLS